MRHPSVMAAGSVAGVGELVERFYDWLWNAWDDNAVESTLAENLAFRGSLGQETTGRDGWRSYRDQVRRGAPNFTNFVLDLVAADDRAAARLRYIGTHRGPLLGLAGTGRAFAYDGAAFFRAQGGLLVGAWVLGDLDGLRQQLAEAQ